MIADTTFLSDFLRERRRRENGRATIWLARHRSERVRTTIISAGEIAVHFDDSLVAWRWVSQWRIYRLGEGVTLTAADLDREMIARGARLGENDNWIAGFCRYYGEPLISRDEGFDRVTGLRRISY